MSLAEQPQNYAEEAVQKERNVPVNKLVSCVQ